MPERDRDELYLAAANIDDLARMNVALLSELWVMRDRMAVLERLLADKGVIEGGEIDDIRPDEALADQLRQLRDEIVRNVAGAPFKSEERTVDALREIGRKRLRASE